MSGTTFSVDASGWNYLVNKPDSTGYLCYRKAGLVVCVCAWAGPGITYNTFGSYTMPSGYRPKDDLMFYGVEGYFGIGANGTTKWYNLDANSYNGNYCCATYIVA